MPKNCQLMNNIAPDIFLELSPTNGPKWHSYRIDYQQTGNIPSSTNLSTNWSPWNIKDKQGNYYGTITIHSDGQSLFYTGEYVPGSNGFSVEEIKFHFNPDSFTYTLTVDKVNKIQNNGPFPNTPIATPATYSASKEKIILSVSGNKIVNNKHETIQLKGFARPSLEWNRQGQMLSQTDLDNMMKWGANTLRLSMNQNYWFESGPVTEKGSYKQIINALIEEANLRGIAVILDLHWTENGHQSPMANKKSIQFWKEVAQEYKDFGTVIFELFNEPVNIDKKVWLHGDNTYAGYQELYDAVRSTEAKNICIINGLDWGYDISFVNDQFKVNGYNIIYGSHPYNDKADLVRMRDNYKNVVDKYPLIFTEFGVNTISYFPNGYQQVYSNIMQIAQEAGISYSAWAWWVEQDPTNSKVFPCIIANWDGEPLNGGEFVKADMTNNPVRPINIASHLQSPAIYSSVKQQKLHGQIKQQIDDLQKEVSRRTIFYKILNGIFTLIPDGQFFPIKKIVLFLANQCLDISGTTENNNKIHTLQALLSANSAEEAKNIIHNSKGLNHQRNVFKRIISQLAPNLFKTKSKKLAEKITAVLPDKKYNPFAPLLFSKAILSEPQQLEEDFSNQALQYTKIFNNFTPSAPKVDAQDFNSLKLTL